MANATACLMINYCGAGDESGSLESVSVAIRGTVGVPSLVQGIFIMFMEFLFKLNGLPGARQSRCCDLFICLLLRSDKYFRDDFNLLRLWLSWSFFFFRSLDYL